MLALIRYIKYGFPLVGKLNRIMGLVTLAWKRQHQHIEAARAKRARQLLWEKKPKHVREQDAAIMIQSAFRAQKARKMVHTLRLIKMDQEYKAVLKIQYVLSKKKLRRKREYLRMKREELIRLQSLKEKGLSDKQKLRIYELRDELMAEAKDEP